jgi:DNA-binding NarL/FixJ family response regulator
VTSVKPAPDRRPRVLLVDDHPSVLIAFGRLLRTTCDVVGHVSNGYEAIQAVNDLKPDLVVVDLMMPGLDGLEVCRQVKKLAPETDVIIVTAYDDMDVETIARQIGASAFVPKYSAAGALDCTIQRIFAERQSVADT